MTNEFGKFLKFKRGEKSLRSYSEYLGISHAYLDSLEKGYDPKTKKEISVGSDIMLKISEKTHVSVGTILSMISGTPFQEALELEEINEMNISEEPNISNKELEEIYKNELNTITSIDKLKKCINNVSDKDLSQVYKGTLINMVDYYHDLTEKDNKKD